MVFDRGLTADEIESLYLAAAAGACKAKDTTLTVSTGPAIYGQSVTLSATLTSGGSPVAAEPTTFLAQRRDDRDRNNRRHGIRRRNRDGHTARRHVSRSCFGVVPG